MSNDIVEASNKGKIADLAKIVKEFKGNYITLTEELHFLRTTLKRSMELIKKYYKHAENPNEISKLKADLEAEVAGLIYKKNEIDKEINGVSKTFSLLHTSQESQTGEKQKEALLHEKFLLTNILREKESQHLKHKNDYNNLLTLKYFKEQIRDVYIEDPCNLSKYFKSFLKEYFSATITPQLSKKDKKKHHIAKSPLSCLYDNINEQVTLGRQKQYNDKIKSGYIAKTFNTKFNKEIILDIKNFSSDESECSSESENEYSFDTFSSDNSLSNNSGTSDDTCSKNSAFNSLSSGNNQNDQGNTSNSHCNVKEYLLLELNKLQRRIQKEKETHKKYTRKIEIFQSHEKKMNNYIKQLNETIRLSSAKCANGNKINEINKELSNNTRNISIAHPQNKSTSKVPFINPVTNV